MIKRIAVLAMFLIVMGFSPAFAVQIDSLLPPIEVDISNSTFEKINSSQFRIRNLAASDYPGNYWVDFLWNPASLIFEPKNVGEEPSTSSVKSGVAIVARSGGQYSDPVTAMNDIATWCGSPSEINPCLMKILPGVYDIGADALTMKPYVDIEGSGENITKITKSGQSRVITGSGPAEIRHITVEHRGGTTTVVALLGSPSLKLSDVTIIAKDGTDQNYGIFSQLWLIDIPPSPPLILNNVTIIASGGNEAVGVYSEFYGMTTIIKNSYIKGMTYSLESYASVRVLNTQLVGPTGGDSAICASYYDENYAFYANTCP